MTREARLMSGIILITVPTIPIWWVFSADFFDEQGQRLHGEPVAPEFLSRRGAATRASVAPNT
jgi:hypothetical protein